MKPFEISAVGGKSTLELNMAQSRGYIQNPYLKPEDGDVLFHLLFNNKSDDIKKMFSDTKFVCMGGTPKRVEDWSKFLMKELNLTPYGGELKDLTGHGNRYSMFKVGPIVCVNHGMGYPSIMILLHELAKLMTYAGAKDPIFIRLGTSGGIDVPAGTVIVADCVLNDYLKPYLETPVLGKLVQRKGVVDPSIASEFAEIAKCDLGFPVKVGSMVSSMYFYEGTSMKLSAYCDNSEEERERYKEKLKQANVLCIDMEALALAAFTNTVGLCCAVATVVVNDCFSASSDTPSTEAVAEWNTRPIMICCEFIRKHMNRK